MKIFNFKKVFNMKLFLERKNGENHWRCCFSNHLPFAYYCLNVKKKTLIKSVWFQNTLVSWGIIKNHKMTLINILCFRK